LGKKKKGAVIFTKYGVKHCVGSDLPFPFLSIREIGTRQMKLSKETAHGDS